jgi:hypothetical protein
LHKKFKDVREFVEDERRAGRPSASRTEKNVARVKAVLDRDRRLSVRLAVEELGLQKTDVNRIITEDLHMRKIANTWFLHHDNASVTHHSLCENFWLNKISQRFLIHRKALTWLRAISFYSPSSKPTSKDTILGQLKTPRQLRRGLRTTSQVKTFSTATKCGSNAGIIVFDHKEPILEGINCNYMYDQ